MRLGVALNNKQIGGVMKQAYFGAIQPFIVGRSHACLGLSRTATGKFSSKV